jgi:thiosulfate reductase cytochrome b subunit
MFSQENVPCFGSEKHAVCDHGWYSELWAELFWATRLFARAGEKSMAVTTASKAAAPSPTVPVVRKHHLLVRISHWLNIPILLGLGLSGISIYWAAPVFQHHADAAGNSDYLADIGNWVVRHFPILSHGYAVNPSDAQTAAGIEPGTSWFYNHFSLGTGDLAMALNLHWFFAYAFMVNGLLYVVGLVIGGGYKALLPRRTDMADALRMIRYYLGIFPAKLARKPWAHPEIKGKYNALQRSAYMSMPIFGLLAVGTGWAIHKPDQLGWLQGLFGGYDWARIWHFWIMWVFAAFVIPHVVLVVVDGWDTFRSMVVGWSTRVVRGE